MVDLDVGEQAYWDKFYAKKPRHGETGFVFDWFAKYEAVSPLVLPYLAAEAKDQPRILEIGVGNSALPDGLLKDGYTDITCVDFSPVVIEQMSKRHPTVCTCVLCCKSCLTRDTSLC